MPSWTPGMPQKDRVGDPGIGAVSPKNRRQSLHDDSCGQAGL